MFFCSTFLSTIYVISFARNAGDDVRRRHWTEAMGQTMLHLPFHFASAGFVTFIFASSHLYLIFFRSASGPDFEFCVALCYGIVVFVLVTIFKVVHATQFAD